MLNIHYCTSYTYVVPSTTNRRSAQKIKVDLLEIFFFFRSAFQLILLHLARLHSAVELIPPYDHQ